MIFRAAITDFRLVIIDDLDVKGVTLTPPETDPPLLVDPDAVLALAIVFQSLELIRARNRKILQVSSGVQLLQLHQRPVLNVARKTLGVLATPDPFSLPASKGLDHLSIVTVRVSNVKRYSSLTWVAATPSRRALLDLPKDRQPIGHDSGVAAAVHDVKAWMRIS